MKRVFNFQKTPVLVFIAVIFLGNSIQAQDSTKEQKKKQEEAHVKARIESRHFHFVAEYMRPTGGSSRLIHGYGIVVYGDTLESMLPYVGRAFSAGYGSSGDEGGFNFQTKEFDYNIKETKKGGWEITISPKNVRDVSKMSLSVSKSGSAQLYITSNTRQSISYNGYIQ